MLVFLSGLHFISGLRCIAKVKGDFVLKRICGNSIVFVVSVACPCHDMARV